MQPPRPAEPPLSAQHLKTLPAAEPMEGLRVSSSDSDPTLRTRELLGLGSLLVGCLVVGLGVGWFLDDRLDKAPVFTLLGIAVGLAAGIWVSWLRIRQYLRG